jgi:hypothetical protein
VLEFFAADVIQKKKRTGAQDCNVIYAVVHQIRPDGVVLVHRKPDLQFCANAIHARDQNRIAHSGKTRSK